MKINRVIRHGTEQNGPKVARWSTVEVEGAITLLSGLCVSVHATKVGSVRATPWRRVGMALLVQMPIALALTRLAERWGGTACMLSSADMVLDARMRSARVHTLPNAPACARLERGVHFVVSVVAYCTRHRRSHASSGHNVRMRVARGATPTRTTHRQRHQLDMVKVCTLYIHNCTQRIPLHLRSMTSR